MAKLRKNLAWLVQIESIYGSTKIRASVVTPQENGELHSIDAFWRFNNPTKDFADLSVFAYLGEEGTGFVRPETRGRVWGCSHQYTPHHIDSADHARDIARMLGKIGSGLVKANSDFGYLDEADFAGYLGRIGHVIGVTTYYVRNRTPFHNVDGERYRTVDGANLQWWVREVSKIAQESPSKLAELIR